MWGFLTLLILIIKKGDGKLLQFPTNVYPHNVAVEIDPEHPFVSSFTFNGDLLRWGLCENYDNTTGESVLNSYFPSDGKMGVYYNGDTVNINHKYVINYFNNGYDYKYRYTLFQSDPTEVENNDDSDGGLYNIFLLESYFWKDATTENYSLNGVYDTDEDGNKINYQVVYVDGELPNIKPAYYYTFSDGRKKLVGGCYVEIGHERRFIEKVKKQTINRNGENTSVLALYLPLAFNETPKENTRFRIFCNYVISPFYFFKARKDPVISNMDAELSLSPVSIKCDAKYQQANSVTMKYHRWYLYKCNNLETVFNGNGYVRDLENEYNNASTPEAKNEIEVLMNNINNKVIPIATGLGDIINKTIIISSTGDSDFKFSTRINSYSTTTGIAILNEDLPINPIAHTTNNPDNVNETTISYEIVDVSTRLVGDSGAIYNYDMSHTFYEFPFGIDELGRNTQFRIRLEVCTQDGKIVFRDIYKTFIEKYNEAIVIPSLANTYAEPIINSSKRAVHLKWDAPEDKLGCWYSVFRRRIDKTENETPLIYYGTDKECYDYSVGNNKQYEYLIVPVWQGSRGQVFITDVIQPKWCGWSVTALNPNNNKTYGKTAYNMSETWVLSYEANGGTITQNQSRNTHIAVNSYPRVSVDASSYISGSFSAMLGNFDFRTHQFDDYIAKLDRWREFVSLNTPYLLKNTKGDVWVVNISDNPTFEYDESLKGAPVTISFDFIECDSINNITIL